MASFKEAFKAARKAQGAGGTFTWNGKSYSTNYAGETGTKRRVSKAATKSAPAKSPTPRSRSDVKLDRAKKLMGVETKAAPAGDPLTSALKGRAPARQRAEAALATEYMSKPRLEKGSAFIKRGMKRKGK